MAHSYPVWIAIDSCAYNAKKSYGIKKHGEQVINVGTSAKNSHHFATIEIKVKDVDANTKIFKLYVDGIKIKEATVNKGNYEETLNSIKKLAAALN